MSEKILELTDTNFGENIKQGILLADFWATWCGPCRMQTPILQSLAQKVDGSVKIAKVNVDESAAVAEEYRIQSIPTLILFKNGEEVQRLVGVQSEDVLLSAIKDVA